MKSKHYILIVDDDADDREIIKDAFVAGSPDGYEYIFLENGDRLIEYLENTVQDGIPSLVLLDLNMPGKDGRETLRDLKSDKRYQSIPIIVFTTSSSTRDKITAYDLGANCFISKPDTFNKLVELTHSISKLWLQ